MLVMFVILVLVLVFLFFFWKTRIGSNLSGFLYHILTVVACYFVANSAGTGRRNNKALSQYKI